MGTVEVAGHSLAELDELKDHFETMVSTSIQLVVNEVTASLRGTLVAAGPDDLAALMAAWGLQVDGTLAPYVAATYESGALAVGFDLAHQLPLPDGFGIPAVSSDFTSQHMSQAKNRLVGIGDDLWNNTRNELQAGYEAGDSIEELAARVEKAAGVTTSRALTIARTEIGEASNAGSYAQVLMVSDEGDQKKWLATEDSRTRIDHVDADGQTVALTAPFMVGGFAAMYPCSSELPPGEKINCRCTLTYVLSDEPPKQVCSCSGGDGDLQASALYMAKHNTPVTVESETCLCPGSVSSPEETVTSDMVPIAVKQEIYSLFKSQGPISPAYGGAKIWKHLQGMKNIYPDLDEAQLLRIIDEQYAASGGKSSFSAKFKEWTSSAAGKKATAGQLKVAQPKPTPKAEPKPEPKVETPAPTSTGMPSAQELAAEYDDLATTATSSDEAWEQVGVLAKKYGISHAQVTSMIDQGMSEKFGVKTEYFTKTFKLQLDALATSSTAGPVLVADLFDQYETAVQSANNLSDVWDSIQALAKKHGLSDADILDLLDEGSNAKYQTPGGTHLKSLFDYKLQAESPTLAVPVHTVVTEKPPLPSTAPVTAQPVNPTDISHVPVVHAHDLLELFKDTKPVTPGWGGSAIYKTLQDAKAKIKANPILLEKFKGLNDAQLLKLLDQAAAPKAGAKTYYGVVSDWIKTPAGKKAAAAAKAAAGVAPTPEKFPVAPDKFLPPAFKSTKATKAAKVGKKTAKKAAKPPPHVPAASSSQPKAVPKLAPGEVPGLGGGDIEHVSPTVKASWFTSFKVKGVYLSSTPQSIYDTLRALKSTEAAYAELTDLQLIRILDEEGAKKLGVENKNLYEAKVVEWLKTPAGKKAAVEAHMSPEEKAAIKAKQAAADAAKIAKLQEGIKAKLDTVPAFDASTSTFPIVSVSEAQRLQDAQVPWERDEESALKYYTSNSGYTAMNNYLRGKSSGGEQTKLRVAQAQSAMRPSAKPMIFHRGTGYAQFGSARSFADIKAMEGQTMLEPGFLSTSVGGKAGFGGQVRMEVEAPAGTPMAFVEEISHYKGGPEKEMLLAAGMRYKILKVTQQGGTTIVRLRVVKG